jgi:diguanylate cyclase (GGDEF)-like protein
MAVSREVDRIRRYGGDCTLAILDIDHFKAVDDCHGHLAGDSVLRTISHMLQQGLRKTDIIGRQGGDEFLIGLINSTPQVAKEVIQNLLTNISFIRHRTHDGEFRLTLSAGISSATLCPTADELIVLASA